MRQLVVLTGMPKTRLLLVKMMSIHAEKINFTSENNLKGDASLKTNTGNGKCNVSSKTFKGYVEYLGCAIRVAILPFILVLRCLLLFMVLLK
jgi:hypothetical protein